MYSELLAAVCLLFFVLTLPGPGGCPSTSPFGESGDNDPSFDGPSPGSLTSTMPLLDCPLLLRFGVEYPVTCDSGSKGNAGYGFAMNGLAGLAKQTSKELEPIKLMSLAH